MKVSGLDVNKDTIFCAIYDGKKYGKVIEFATFSESIRELAHMLHKNGVKKIAMESTGIYWIPVWNILEEAGFDLMLFNPFLIKQMPGRKSDVKDAQWIAKLLHKGMLRGSLIPCKTIRQLRTYSRRFVKMQGMITRVTQEMEQSLEMKMAELCDKHYAREMELLMSIPGVGKQAAMQILSETGGNMQAFADSGKLTGWTGLRPRNDESAGKLKSKAITHGNKYLRRIMVQCAWAASRTKGSQIAVYQNFLDLCPEIHYFAYTY